MENEYEEVNPTNDTEVTENTYEESDNTETEEIGIDIEAEVKKATAPLYARMKQAEAEAKEAKAKLAQAGSSKTEGNTSGDLSQKDVIYLAKSDIHDDDIDEVLKYASKSGVSVKEAHEYLKPILAVKQEQRKVASAANVGVSKRGSGQVAADILLAKARKGELPTNDDDIDRLIQARKGK